MDTTPLTLSEPVEYEGVTYRYARLLRTAKVRDRIHASRYARDNHPGDDGDAILAATLAQIAELSADLDPAGQLRAARRLPADALIDGLAYGDFIRLIQRMGPATRDFSGSPSGASPPPSPPSAGTDSDLERPS